jgi:hypothetical protein
MRLALANPILAVTAERFCEARDQSKSRNSWRRGFLSTDPPSMMAGHRCWLLDRSPFSYTAGVAISPDGELTNLFNHGPRGDGRRLLHHAVRQGARSVNCFDGFLLDYYKSAGFREVGRLKFDPAFAHDWLPEFGKPDVIFMER